MKRLVSLLLVIVFLQMSFFNIISFAIQETSDENKIDLQTNEAQETPDKNKVDLQTNEAQEIPDKNKPGSQTKQTQEVPDENKINSEINETQEVIDENKINLETNEATDDLQISGTQELENGLYEIYTNVSSTKVFDIDAGKIASNGANLQIWERENRENQKFRLTKNDDGETYTIVSAQSGKVLDVEKARMTNYTNVWQYETNGTDAQKWYLKDCGNGDYNIISALNGLYLDISGGKSANGTNVQVYQGNGTIAQKFKIVKCQPKTGKRVIEKDGIYNIKCKMSENRLLEVDGASTNNNAEIKIGANSNNANQKFNIKFNEEDGTYTIKALHSGLVMDVRGAGNKIGTAVQQYASNNTDAQKWIIEQNEDGTFSIISKQNGLLLDVQGASSNIGTRIQTYYSNKTDAQKFLFSECEPEKAEKTAENGTYRVICMSNLEQVLDIAGGSTQKGALLQTWKISDVPQQSFTLEYDNQGYYKIISDKSKMVLTVESENPKEGSKITQQKDENLDTQKWILKKYSENVYGIISKCGQLYIDIAKPANGQAIQLKSENDLSQQQFVLVEENPQKDIYTELEDGVYQIATKGNNTVVDISAGSQDNNANTQIWQNTGVQQQKFYITKIENTNYYKMTAIHSNKVLDVSDAKKNPHANVAQYSENGTNSQKWLLKKTNEDGWFNIISAVNWLCLDVNGGKVNNSGTNISTYYSNGSDAQKFKFNKVNVINNGTYEIETRLNSNDVVDVSEASQNEGARIQLWEADNVDQQRFNLEAVGWNTYKITAKHSGKAITVGADNFLIQKTYEGTPNQQWEILPAGNEYYFLSSKVDGKVLDIFDGKVNNGQKIWVYKKNGTLAQQFRFVTGKRTFYQEGIYGYSGFAYINDWRGTGLRYYKIGKGPKVLFTVASIHGFEDSYAHDGVELTYIAEEFIKYLKVNIPEDIIRNWTIYVLPQANPDGQVYGWTNNGPGRCTISQGIDMNRNWSVGYKRERSSRYFNGSGPMEAYEVSALGNFILSHRGSSNILVDLHGWLNQTIGDNGLGVYYRNHFGISGGHVGSYGSGYLINWARTIGNARSVLVELPEVRSHTEVIQRDYAWKFISATLQMIREN